MNIQIVNDGALLNQHKFQFLKQYVYNFPNLIRYSKNSNNDIYVNFVGFFEFRDDLFLVLPKSVRVSEYSTDALNSLVLKYARFFDFYVNEVHSAKKYVNFDFIGSFVDWVSNELISSSFYPVLKLVAYFNFEKTFEWMLAKYFKNQLFRKDDSYFFKSTFLPSIVNLKSVNCSVYNWEAIGKQNSNNRHKDVIRRDFIFSSQDRLNIPDIVCERVLTKPLFGRPQKCCAIIDAKYYGWNFNSGSYLLPANRDIYKQFFYQDVINVIYSQENMHNVAIYNFIALPDYLGDASKTKYGLIRNCGVIRFKIHPEHTIGVLQVDIDRLIDFLLLENDKSDLLVLFMRNDKLSPMVIK